MQLLPCQIEMADTFVSRKGRIFLSSPVGHGKSPAAAECHRRSMAKYPTPHLYLTTKSAMDGQVEKFLAFGVEAVLVNSSADKRIEVWKNPENKVYITTLEALSCSDKEWKHMRKVPFGMIGIDEADRLTGSASKGKRRLFMLSPRHRMMMTATPLRNGLKDAFVPLMWLSRTPLWRNWTDFKSKELLHNNPLLPHMITGIRDENYLAGQLAPFMCEMINPDAPKELVAKIVDITISDAEREAYDKMKETLLIEAESGLLTISNHAVLNLRLRQFIQLPEVLDYDIPSTKEEEVLTLLDRDSEHSIIFTSFATVAEALAERHGWSAITGKMSKKRRSEIVSKKPQVIIATSAAERGIDMPFLSHVISMDAGFTEATLKQRAGRATRYGREGEADLTLLRARNTVDVTSEAKIILRKLKEARKVWQQKIASLKK